MDHQSVECLDEPVDAGIGRNTALRIPHGHGLALLVPLESRTVVLN